MFGDKQKFYSCVKYAPCWPGMFRIVIWTLLFLFIFGFVIPKRSIKVPFEKNVAGTKIIQMITFTDNLKFVRDDVKIQNAEKTIAWIAGSSALIYHDNESYDIHTTPMDEVDLLPIHVLSSLKNDYGIDAAVDYIYGYL